MLKVPYIKSFQLFFRNKLSISVCCIILFFQLIIYFTFFQEKSLILFPDKKNIQIDFYNDSADKGKSVITSTSRTSSSVKMSFILKDGFIRPYVGIELADKAHTEFDISLYNRMKIDVSGEGIKPIFVYLILKDSNANLDWKVSRLRHLCQYIEISHKRKLFKLSIDDFKTPDWWFDKYNLSPSTIKPPYLNRLFRVALATGLTPSLNQKQSIQIYSIVFYRDNTLVVLLMIVAQIIIIALMLLKYHFRTRRKKQIKSVTINYHAVTLEKKQKSKTSFSDYINENFHNSDLSLHLISEQTGVSQRNIAESIFNQFNCNVKTYINQIRINEAQRLLKETDLNISEIAYKVGFSSPSNFNRVFKNFTRKNPSEFLLNKD